MGIHNYLDASTWHITNDDCFSLFMYGDELSLYYFPYDEGVFISVCDAEKHGREELEKFEFSDGFIRLIEYAESMECPLIRLDRDAPIIENLPWNRS